MEQLTIKELYSDLNKTLAKELLESKTYPWEVLPCIGEFIQKLGETLSEEEYEKKGENILTVRLLLEKTQRCVTVPLSVEMLW